MTKPISKRTNIDGHWKEMITEFFEDFVAFFLPQLYPHVDFSYPPEFMDTELQNILESIGIHKRVLDKLVKVRLKNGKEKWILIHIEVQSYFEKLFSERMFLLFAMIFAKFRQKITAIVIYTNKKTPKLFDCFEHHTFGTHILYKFLAYKIAQQKEEVLLKSNSIFALFVLANLYVTQTGKKDRRRLLMKEKLIELATERLIDLDKIGRLLIFVDGIMQLSKDLEEEFKTLISVKYKNSSNMESILAKGNRKFARIFFEAEYGDTYENSMAKLKRQEAALNKQEAEMKKRYEAEMKKRNEFEIKQQLEKQSSIMQTLYFEKAWTIEQIADLLKLEKDFVQKVVAKSNKKK